MGFISYYKYIAYIKDQVKDSITKYRVKWARIILLRVRM